MAPLTGAQSGALSAAQSDPGSLEDLLLQSDPRLNESAGADGHRTRQGHSSAFRDQPAPTSLRVGRGHCLAVGRLVNIFACMRMSNLREPYPAASRLGGEDTTSGWLSQGIPAGVHAP